MQVTATITLLLAVLAAPAALAAPASGPPAPARRVVLAPLSTLGSEATSRMTRAIAGALAAELAAVPHTAIIKTTTLRRAIRKARRPQITMCDGDARCLADLGTLVGATHVVYGELGGLGNARVLALKLVDVAARRTLRSTTAEFGAGHERRHEARAAVYRLLAPQQYRGRLVLDIDIERAQVFIDGSRVATSPHRPIAVMVGTHALRITHPEYRDYVRFIDIRFERDTKLSVGMRAFPIVEDAMRERRTLVASGQVPRARAAPAWYKHWAVVAGATAALFIGSAVIVGLASDGIDADRVEVVGQ